jgi:hypothetical protein
VDVVFGQIGGVRDGGAVAGVAVQDGQAVVGSGRGDEAMRRCTAEALR